MYPDHKMKLLFKTYVIICNATGYNIQLLFFKYHEIYELKYRFNYIYFVNVIIANDDWWCYPSYKNINDVKSKESIFGIYKSHFLAFWYSDLSERKEKKRTHRVFDDTQEKSGGGRGNSAFYVARDIIRISKVCFQPFCFKECGSTIRSRCKRLCMRILNLFPF